MKPLVIFILGGPGSGKGTQCQLIQEKFQFVHLSAGDLLRAERKNPNSQNGKLIQQCIVHGKIVPSQITIQLLYEAMNQKGLQNGKFLIDGFPRNQQNLGNWFNMMEQKVLVPFMIHLDCSEEVMTQRLLKRGQTSGRTDDNIDSIKKRFNTYHNQTKDVVKHFQQKQKLVNVKSDKSIESVFEQLKEHFQKLLKTA